MNKNFYIVLVFFSTILLVGCSTVKLHTYVDKKERVDQGVSGNAGAIVGSTKGVSQPPVKPTRNIYVVEVSKEQVLAGQKRLRAFAHQDLDLVVLG